MTQQPLEYASASDTTKRGTTYAWVTLVAGVAGLVMVAMVLQHHFGVVHRPRAQVAIGVSIALVLTAIAAAIVSIRRGEPARRRQLTGIMTAALAAAGHMLVVAFFNGYIGLPFP